MHGEPATNWNNKQNDLSRGAANTDQYTYRRSSKRLYYNAKVLFSTAAEISLRESKKPECRGCRDPVHGKACHWRCPYHQYSIYEQGKKGAASSDRALG